MDEQYEFADFDLGEEKCVLFSRVWEGLKTSALVFGLIGLGMLITKVLP